MKGDGGGFGSLLSLHRLLLVTLWLPLLVTRTGCHLERAVCVLWMRTPCDLPQSGIPQSQP